MSRLRAFARFWWDFVVGDDWTVVAGLAVALGLTALLTHDDVNAWWLLPGCRRLPARCVAMAGESANLS